MSDIGSIIFILLTFGAVVGAVFRIGRYVSVQRQCSVAAGIWRGW